MVSALDEILERFDSLPEASRAALLSKVNKEGKRYVPNPGPQTEAYLSKADLLLFGGCVSPDTEFMTPTGWKRIDKYEEGDQVAQWDKEDSSLTFTKPLNYTDLPCTEFIKFSNSRVSMLLSPCHRMPLYNYQGKFAVKLASEIEKNPSRYKIPANYSILNSGMEISDTLLRLSVAIHADGSLEYFRKTDGGAQCRISLIKQRKKDRLVSLLSALGIKWKECPRSNRKTEIRYTFESPVLTKSFTEKWWGASQKQLEIILEEMSYWDGDVSGARGGDICFYTTIKSDADFMQFAAHACGRIATIGRRVWKNKKWADLYRVFISREGSLKSVIVLRGDAIKIKRIPADRMYCFTVPTSFWLARHDGNIFVTGNSPGGGKTGLLGLLALQEHERSLIVRKQFSDLEGVLDNLKSMVGEDGKGFVGGTRPKYRKPDGGVIHFEGLSKAGGVDTGKQGNARDFIGIDEGAQLSEVQVRLLFGWLRELRNTSGEKKRCRMVIATNPPLDPIGDWMLNAFGAWLDPAHPNPAKDGELRWYVFDGDDKSREVPHSGKHEIDGKVYDAHSRTFIKSIVEDNPFLDAEEYRRSLDVMPEPFRTILREGNFMYARKDQAFQVIPTQWVREAQARWTPKPPIGCPMCAIGVDVARGGSDNTVLAIRHDGWYAPLIVIPGVETPKGSDVAGHVIANRRDNAHVIIDMGGGYGGAPLEHLEANIGEKYVYGHVPSHGSTSRTSDGLLQFFNARSEMWWKFREALDPGQLGGSWIALPDDAIMVADLCAPTFSLENGKIKVESKMDGVDSAGNPKPGIVRRLGRSTDRGDGVVLGWSKGSKALQTTLTQTMPDYRIAPTFHDENAGCKVITRNPNRRR